MSPLSTAWPDCEIVQVLVYIHGNCPGDNLPTTPCGGGPSKAVEIRGAPTHASVTGEKVAGPVHSFTLCQHHRKEAAVRSAKLSP